MGAKPIERIDRHKDASVKAQGRTVNDVLAGYSEWSKRRHEMWSGYFCKWQIGR
jgi:hypothetical protein